MSSCPAEKLAWCQQIGVGMGKQLQCTGSPWLSWKDPALLTLGTVCLGMQIHISPIESREEAVPHGPNGWMLLNTKEYTPHLAVFGKT